MLGMFINTLPVRLEVGERGVRESLRATHALLAQLIRHEHAPLSLSQRAAQVPAQTPLFSGLLNYRHSEQAVSPSSSDDDLEDVEALWTEERTNYPFCLDVDDLGTDFLLTAQVSAPESAERVCEFVHTALSSLLKALEEQPDLPISEVDVLPAAERELVLKSWNGGRDVEFEAQCIHELVAEVAAGARDRVAVEFGSERLSYGELNRRANQLGRYLRGLGVEPEARVVLFAGRGIGQLLGLLSIWKAGGAYVPVEPGQPSERLAQVLSDSGAVVVVGEGEALREIRRLVPEQIEFVDLSSDAAKWSGLSTEDLSAAESGVRPEHLAYVIYTSGSTGRPKGVMVEHRSLHNYARDASSWFELAEGERVLHQNSLNFDLSLEEVVPALLAGGTVVATRQWYGSGASGCETAPSVIHLTAAHWHTLVSEWQVSSEKAHSELSGVRLLNVTGDALSGQKLAQWEQLRPRGTRLINTYGPTEGTVSCTAGYMDGARASEGVTIGKPFANTPIFILDEGGAPCPVGVSGELHIGGVQVARGYLNQAEQTAERFVDSPLEGGGRLYKTGDLGRWQADGRVEFLGRRDDQVKIRGYRVELGEVEARLSSQPEVAEVAVVARANDSGEKELFAYYTGPAAPSAEELNRYARGVLADYMVPTGYVKLPRLPLTANGKVDRKALPTWEQNARCGADYVAPEGETEQAIARIWAELLRVDRVGRHDNFFELGGHSLLAVQLLSRIQRALNVQLGLIDLFEQPILHELAEKIGNTNVTAMQPIRRVARRGTR